jgi:hypothetical protein
VNSRPRLLRCVLFNARSLRNKLRTLEALCKAVQYDIIAITETWFCREDLSLINPITKFYQVISFERARRGGGGVLLLARKGLPLRHMPDMPGGDCECAWVEVVCKPVNVRFAVFYRPPEADEEVLLAINEKPTAGASFSGVSVVTGDFNFPGIRWFDEETVTGSTALERRFVAQCEELSLEQQVSEPTHDAGNVLDLVLCDRVGAITEASVISKFHERCDHYMVEFTVTGDASCETTTPAAARPCFTRWDPTSAHNDLQANPIDFSGCASADELWSVFESRSESIIANCVPHVAPTTRRFLWPYTIRRAANNQRKLWKQFKDGGRVNEAIKARHHEASKQVRSMKFAYLHNREDAILRSGSSKRFFSYVNGRLSSHAQIPNLRKQDGSWASTDEERAELLAAQFSSTYREDDGNVPPTTQNTETVLESVEFTFTNVGKVVEGLKSDFCSGPDGLPRAFFNKFSETLVPILVYMFTFLIAIGTVPSAWLLANVTALYKGKGSRFDPENYRDISLTAVASKCMESVVRDALIKHLIAIGMMSPHQHGFLPGLSTLTQMLCTVHE